MKIPSRSFLKHLAHEACLRFSLKKVYFVEVLGKRKHFLVGAGEEAFLSTKSALLEKNLMVCWQGELKCAEDDFLTFLKEEIITRSTDDT